MCFTRDVFRNPGITALLFNKIVGNDTKGIFAKNYHEGWLNADFFVADKLPKPKYYSNIDYC